MFDAILIAAGVGFYFGGRSRPDLVVAVLVLTAILYTGGMIGCAGVARLKTKAGSVEPDRLVEIFDDMDEGAHAGDLPGHRRSRR